jgi:hypothetical protein
VEPISIAAGAYSAKAALTVEKLAEVAAAKELAAKAVVESAAVPGEAAALAEHAGVSLDKLAEAVIDSMQHFSPLRAVREIADDPDDRKALGAVAGVTEALSAGAPMEALKGDGLAAASEIPLTVELIDGKYPIHGDLAGHDVPLSDFKGITPESKFFNETIHWSEEGFPDFTPWVHKTDEGKVCDVPIEPTGTRKGDAEAANEACGLDRTPPGYSWHHHEDTGRMQLVPSELHGAVGHTGGFSIWGKHAGAAELAAPVELPEALARSPEERSLWDRVLGLLGVGGDR